MKKLSLVATAVTMLFTVSCSADNSTTANEQAHEHHEGMAHNDDHHDAHPEGMPHDQPATAAGVVVNAPDYSAADAAFKKQLAQLLDQYMNVKDALVASDATAAKKAANTIAATAKALPLASLQDADQKDFAQEHTEKIRKTASGIASTGDIKTQREQLEGLSEAVFALTKAFDATENTLYYQHCPMALNNKGGYWLSSSKEISNPYFGAKMLKCGSTKEVLN
ncbi:DUF3347 domain-containing protein [Botryobacter ruber]|uniref:DUF3347 domain-containing protein n=1 Tax=Botryobacter ruber TaxID=2171629 RepID=UPI000E0BAFF0|nr:DUF3347 domain-containing protein [Botryobacter ruber]